MVQFLGGREMPIWEATLDVGDVTFIEHLFGMCQAWSKCFTSSISLNRHDNPVKWVLFPTSTLDFLHGLV